MIDLNASSMIRSVGVSAIHAALDAVPPREEKRRAYIGASAIGGACERKLQYEFMQAPHDPGWRFSARTLRVFQRGHMIEEAAAGWLADAGYQIKRLTSEGFPIGFSVANGEFKGHVDGVITAGPEIETPCVWEHKAVGAKSWKAIESRGLAKSKPEYADQVALYQAYLDLTAPALFMATNMDTMEIYLELVAFDRVRAQAASDRAVAIIKDSRAGSLRARPTEDPSFYACTDCPFRNRCWS